MESLITIEKKRRPCTRSSKALSINVARTASAAATAFGYEAYDHTHDSGVKHGPENI